MALPLTEAPYLQLATNSGIFVLVTGTASIPQCDDSEWLPECLITYTHCQTTSQAPAWLVVSAALAQA